MNDIILDIKEIIVRIRPELDGQILDSKYNNKLLTGKEFQFTAEMMVYLMLEIEKKYKIVFIKEDLLNYKFNTIVAIAEEVETKLQLTK